MGTTETRRPVVIPIAHTRPPHVPQSSKLYLFEAEDIVPTVMTVAMTVLGAGFAVALFLATTPIWFPWWVVRKVRKALLRSAEKLI